jgi:hypothetical protein
MVTAPLVVILGLVAFFLVKGKASNVWAALVNVLLGIALASTILGPPMISGLESGSNAVIQGVSNSIGTGR